MFAVKHVYKARFMLALLAKKTKQTLAGAYLFIYLFFVWKHIDRGWRKRVR